MITWDIEIINGCNISKYIGQALYMSVSVFASVQLVSLCEGVCELTCIDVSGVQPLG